MQNEALDEFSRLSGSIYRMYFRNINIYELEGSHVYAQSKFRIWKVSKTHAATEPGKYIFFEMYFVI